MRVEHTLKPIFNKESKTLILGSMPSIKSREIMKYYGHKTNRFWPIMEGLYEESIDDWQDFILRHHLALWDTIASCDIHSSSDSSIKNVVPNDIKSLVDSSNIEHIFLLGNTAYKLYKKYIEGSVGIEGILLPSPSSANATYSLEKLIEEYKIIKDVTENK